MAPGMEWWSSSSHRVQSLCGWPRSVRSYPTAPQGIAHPHPRHRHHHHKLQGGFTHPHSSRQVHKSLLLHITHHLRFIYNTIYSYNYGIIIDSSNQLLHAGINARTLYFLLPWLTVESSPSSCFSSYSTRKWPALVPLPPSLHLSWNHISTHYQAPPPPE